MNLPPLPPPADAPVFGYSEREVLAYGAACAAAERERCVATWHDVLATAHKGERYDEILRRYNERIGAGS